MRLLLALTLRGNGVHLQTTAAKNILGNADWNATLAANDCPSEIS